MTTGSFLIALFFIALLSACHSSSESKPSEALLPQSSAIASKTAEPEAKPPAVEPVILIAGGDIDLSRITGQRILKDPSLDPFASVRPWLKNADLRFANLESVLCDLGGKTVADHNRLIFAGPPQGAEVMRRGGFEIVSTANNHAWDFGLRCLQETTENLQRVGIRHVGTDGTGKDPLRPEEFETKGQRFAFFAVTSIFNHGPLEKHEAKAYLAQADKEALERRITQLRDRVDHVVVSVHAGEEYRHIPIEATRRTMIGAIEAGADMVLGHHSHTPQRIEFHKGKPVVMSLGNFVFHQHRDHPWTGWSYLVRLTLMVDRKPAVEICPFHIFDASPRPLTEAQQKAFLQHWDRISRAPKAGRRQEPAADSCFRILEP